MPPPDIRPSERRPVVIRVGPICHRELDAIRKRFDTLLIRMKRVGMPYEQINEDLSSLILWARAKLRQQERDG